LKAVRSAKSLHAAWRTSKLPFFRFAARLDKQGIPYLSHSKVACFERCPLCYYSQYVLLVSAESDAMRTGTLFHLAAKTFYASLQSGGAKPTAASLLNRKQMAAVPVENHPKLRNALSLMRAHHWEAHEIVSVEEPFFMDLAPGLPPVMGIPDLVLRQGDSLLVVDHKTSKTFPNLEPAQLVLYAEHLRRKYETRSVVGVFDQYRLVPDLDKIKKPAFRRTPVAVDSSLLPGVLKRYRAAWKSISEMRRGDPPAASYDCWTCNGSNFYPSYY
jgi:hypothetical protein